MSGVGEMNGVNSSVFFGNAPSVFDLDDLMRSSAEVLGEGLLGTAYKAVLASGTVVLKRLRGATIAQKRFKEMIEVVGGIDHENLLPLRAYYCSINKKFLVYDYMPMGSLSELLHGKKRASRTILNWEMRAGIALGAARGVTFLHSQGPDVSHGNLKSSNILLTESYEARVSEFGLGPLFEMFARYLPPEVLNPRKLSQKADVYSFDMVLLELLTGKALTDVTLLKEGINLPLWVRSMVELGRASEVFDHELLKHHKVEQEMVRFLLLAIDCTQAAVTNRPSMPEVTKRIEEICASRVTDADDGHTHFINPFVRTIIDYEKEVNELLELFQALEKMVFSVKHEVGKKFASMAREIEEMRAELASLDKPSGGSYGKVKFSNLNDGYLALYEDIDGSFSDRANKTPLYDSSSTEWDEVEESRAMRY